MQKTNHHISPMMTKDVVVGMDGNHTINNSAAVGPNTLHNIYSYPTTTTTTTTNNYLLPNYNNNTTGNNNNNNSSTTSSPFNLTSPNCLSSPIITPNSSSTNSNNLDNNNNNNNNNSNQSSNNNSPLIEKENNKHNLPSTVNLNSSLNNNSSLTDLEQQVNFYKERFDTFKKGFLIERTSRLKTINDLYKFTKKMEILQKQLFEKDSALFALTNENIKLKEEIYEMNSNHLGDNTLSSTSTNNSNSNNNSFNSNGRDRSPSEVNNNKKKLLPNFSFKRRNTELNNNSSLQSMDGSSSNSSNGNSGNGGNINGNQNNNKNSSSNNSSNNNLNNQNANDAIKEMKHWRELYRKVSSDLKKKEKEISDLTSSEHITKQMLMETQSKFKQQENVLQKSNENIQQLKMEIFQKENENRENLKKIELVELQYNDLQKLNEQLQNKLKEDEEIINGLRLELEEKQMHIKKLTEKCFEMKTQLNFVRLQIRKYKCKRITKTMLTATKNDCVIVLHKNPQNGLLWIDIKVKNKKDNQPLDDENNLGNSVQSFPLTSIVDIVPDVHDVKRFTIYFYSKGNVNNNNNNGFVQKPIVETFECVDENERTEVMQGIQEFISIAQSTLL
ncbi:hypothetical protein ABK040_012347 [Willaertia magna]